jgi:hypothetical protein
MSLQKAAVYWNWYLQFTPEGESSPSETFSMEGAPSFSGMLSQGTNTSLI